VATGEVVNIKARTVTRTQFGQQIARIRGDGSTPLTPAQQQEIADLRAEMKRALADPTVATRWNWNTPFILSRHDPNVFYSGAEKLFKSVKQGVDPVAISPDLSTGNENLIRITTGFDADGNPAADATGGITRDATGAEENATIVTIGESPLRAGLLYVGTNDGKVWLTRNDGGKWEDLSGRFPGVPPFTYVSKVEPSGADTGTVYVAFDNHRENDFTPYLFVSTDFGKTFTRIDGGLPRTRPNTIYVVREDPVNRDLLYVGTELGVSASLDRGRSWFPLEANLPTVPVYDLQVHPRDRELIAGTHGRGIQILDVAPLQQMTASVVAAPVHLFQSAVALQYGERPVGSEPRAHRMWRGERVPAGAAIRYRLAQPVAGAAPRLSIVNIMGDTIARLVGTNVAGLNTVTWPLTATGAQPVPAAFAGGFGGFGQEAPAATASGFPAGFNPRPAERLVPADSTGSPTYQARQLAQARPTVPGPRGQGGGGFGGGRPSFVDTGDYRVVLQAGAQTFVQPLRVVRVAPEERSVLVPGKR
jgi:hypothetical protein